MSKTLKQILIASGLMIIGLTIANIAPALAQGTGGGFLNPQDMPTAVGQAGGSKTLRELAVTIINYVLGFLGLIAVAMIIYGGVSYVTAAGDQTKVDNAKKVIMYAIIGLVIVILSYAIVSAVLGAGTGSAA